MKLLGQLINFILMVLGFACMCSLFGGVIGFLWLIFIMLCRIAAKGNK